MNEVSKDVAQVKRLKGLCVVKFCGNKTAKTKSGKHDKYCHRCRRRLLKERHPYTYWYDLLRSNVKRRKIRFALTKEEFIRFCKENNYLELKGRGAGKATIDRKKSDPQIGYTYENIQILEHASNSRKVHIDKKLRQMYDTGQEPTEREISDFKMELESFGHSIELYQPSNNRLYDF